MPNPTELTVHQKSRVLLRVYSPSAEVKGHGPGQEVLQVGKRAVGINGVEPIGNYGIKPLFTDGHDTGIYTWDYLYKLGNEQQALWQDYLRRLHGAGFEGDSGREAGTVLPGASVRAGGCGHHH
jgi:DUF971 family protein